VSQCFRGVEGEDDGYKRLMVSVLPYYLVEMEIENGGRDGAEERAEQLTEVNKSPSPSE
jgi:hypothetical protein